MKHRARLMKPISIEIEAKSTKEAIHTALKQLKAKRSDVEIRILREEHKGLFGMEGAEPAKIKVTLKSRKVRV